MIETHLYSQWTNYLKDSLNHMGVLTEDIDDKSIPIYYFEYYLRTLNTQKYEVFVSRELKQNEKYQKYQTIIEEIIQKAQNGQDLNPHLSRGIKKITTPDRMLNDWGVLHLHLSNILENDGFMKRTKELLFVYRDIHVPQKLYILDIFSHSDWSKQKTIEILHSNWTDAIDRHKMKNIIDIQPKPNDEERQALRTENINSAVVLQDELAYITLGGGLTTIGTNIESSMFQIQYMKFFAQLEKDLILKYRVRKEQLHLKVVDKKAFVYIDSDCLVENSVPLSILILSDVEFDGGALV